MSDDDDVVMMSSRCVQAMCVPVTFQDLERDCARKAMEADAAEAMFRDKAE